MTIMQAPARAKGLLLRIGLSGLTGSVCLALAACREEVPLDDNVLAADVHVAVAGYQMVLPFIAWEHYGAGRSFSLQRKKDGANQADTTTAFLGDAGTLANPMSFDRLSIRIDTYGWNDADAAADDVSNTDP
ncbi:hypothetical protein [Pseudoduganella buxea]|uniref:Uncharacterized protein n=1 Tax=Pseudoduganella buxea TaxID=1949069 RepID=A0A6I3T475_9BURK|nr:hypothetical protein [Pseudoduganella buxea]MTV55282.1 hypothetical protein [Pseudoduganella buxea]GGB86369.1 hypothetical protein GCM10011572_05420 [Pseudoduganella buxea]